MRIPILEIVGTWHIDGMPSAENGILVMMENGRAIQFLTSITKPRMNETMRLWYSGFDGEKIRFRSSPNGKEWFRRVEMTLKGWDMVAEDQDETLRFHCSSADLETLPLWYAEMLEKNLAKMIELEKV